MATGYWYKARQVSPSLLIIIYAPPSPLYWSTDHNVPGVKPLSLALISPQAGSASYLGTSRSFSRQTWEIPTQVLGKYRGNIHGSKSVCVPQSTSDRYQTRTDFTSDQSPSSISVLASIINTGQSTTDWLCLFPSLYLHHQLLKKANELSPNERPSLLHKTKSALKVQGYKAKGSRRFFWPRSTQQRHQSWPSRSRRFPHPRQSDYQTNFISSKDGRTCQQHPRTPRINRHPPPPYHSCRPRHLPLLCILAIRPGVMAHSAGLDHLP